MKHINTFFLAAITFCLVILIFRAAPHPAKTTWQYQSFHFVENPPALAGQPMENQLCYVQFGDWNDKPKIGDHISLSSIGSLLSMLSSDGWELISAQNDLYIVRRPSPTTPSRNFMVIQAPVNP